MQYLPSILRKRVAAIAIREYAALSYCYYEHNVSPRSDGEFDELCRWLLAEYDNIKKDDINDYLDRESLKAGTGFNIAGRVCGQTRDYAEQLLKEAEQRANMAKIGVESRGSLSVRDEPIAMKVVRKKRAEKIQDDDDDDLGALLGKR